MIDTVERLQKEFDILAVIDLNQVLIQPYSWLFQQLKPLWIPCFGPNQKILFTYTGYVSQELADHVQKIVSHIDISNCFLHLICYDSDATTRFTQAHKQFGHGPVSIACEVVTGEPEHLEQTTTLVIPETMCMAPWAKLEITTQGEFMPCCVIGRPIVDESGKPYNIQNDSFEKVYSSAWMKRLRHQFLEGRKPLMCASCWIDEDKKIASIRQHISWQLRDHRYEIPWHSPSTKNLLSVDISLGNACNLKCRICDGDRSSLAAQEQLNDPTFGDQARKRLLKVVSQSSWPTQRNLLSDEIEKVLPNLYNLNFTGGEPMLSKPHVVMLRRLIETGESAKITLQYTSNATVFSDQLAELWPKFKQVEISLSLDDVSERFEYQRDGADWSAVLAVIDKYQNLKQVHSKIKLFANCTVSILNVFYLDEICKWLGSKQFDSARLNILKIPAELSIYCVPTAIRTDVVNKLKNISCDANLTSQIESVINTILGSDKKYVSPDRVIAHLQRLDQRKKQDFRTSHKEIAQLIGYSLPYKGTVTQ